MAALALFGLVQRTLNVPAFSQRIREGSTQIATAIAGFWAMHPLQTESITYVSQRAESLAGLFYILTLYCLLRSDGSSRGGIWQGLSCVACFLGASTKEIVVTVPLMALLYDRAFLSTSFGQAFRKRGGFYAALASSWLWLGFLMLKFGFVDSGVGFGSGWGTLRYCCTEAMVIVRYVRLALWPSSLVFDYGPELAAASVKQALPFVVVVFASLVGAILLWRRSRPLGFLATGFFILLAPTSSFVPVQGQAMAESRMYLPLVAIVAPVTIAIYLLMGFRALAVYAALALSLGAATFERNKKYGTELGLWEDTISKCPVNSRGRNNLGVALSKDPNRVQDAIAQFEEALRIAPKYAEAHCNLGITLERVEARREEAIAHFREAIRLNPDYALAYNNLGSALADEGATDEAVRVYKTAIRIQPDLADARDNLANALAKHPEGSKEAIDLYRQAIRLNPDFPEAHYNLANVLVKTAGGTAEAIAEYKAALAINPNFAMAHVNLANTLVGVPGGTADAIAHYEAAITIDSGFAEAHFDLANLLAIQPGGKAAAIKHYQKALDLKPDYAYAHYRLGNVLAASNELDLAESHLRKAIELMPSLAEAHSNLGNVLVLKNRIDEAKKEFAEALRLNPELESARKTLALINGTTS